MTEPIDRWFEEAEPAEGATVADAEPDRVVGLDPDELADYPKLGSTIPGQVQW